MARGWRFLLWPKGAPLWLALLGNLSLFVVVVSAVLLLLPHGIVGKSRFLRRRRSQLLKWVKRMVELSKEGPFYRLFVWCGRRCSAGRLSSRCRAPTAPKARAAAWNEVFISWGPCMPANPFHEENYIIAFRIDGGSGKEAARREQRAKRGEDCEELAGGRLRACIGGLPERTSVALRICAENAWGRSEWSDEASAETLATPSDEGGFTGPLGPAGDGSRSYRWTQTGTEIGLKVPIGADRRGRDIKFKALPTRLEIRCAVPDGQPDELLVGPLHKRIRTDEVTWEIEEDAEHGRHIAAQFTKAEQMEKWPCLIEAEGHPRIDTRLVRIFGRGMGMGGLGGLDIYE